MSVLDRIKKLESSNAPLISDAPAAQKPPMGGAAKHKAAGGGIASKMAMFEEKESSDRSSVKKKSPLRVGGVRRRSGSAPISSKLDALFEAGGGPNPMMMKPPIRASSRLAAKQASANLQKVDEVPENVDTTGILLSRPKIKKHARRPSRDQILKCVDFVNFVNEEVPDSIVHRRSSV
eukprot:271694_1